MKKILIFLALSTPGIFAAAQKYQTAAGVRIGSHFGFTVKQRILKRSTIEGIFQTNLGSKDYNSLTFLWEQHQPIIGKGLNLYYGAGIHKGWMVSKYSELEIKDPAGLSLIAGLEITLGELNLSFDYKPVLNFSGGQRFFEGQSALSVRYVLIKGKKKNKFRLFPKK